MVWISGAIGAVIGWLLAQGVAAFQRRRRVRGLLEAVRAEVTLCHTQASDLLQPKAKMAPLYRLPVFTLDKALPQLLGEGVLPEDDVRKIIRFASVVAELNRGLDEAAEHKGEDDAKLREAFSRNQLKAERLVNGRDGEGPLAPAALEILGRHIRRGGRLLLP